MTSTKKEQENNLRRYKSAIVYNTYGRSDLADMAKSWSFERIEATLGIKIAPKQLYRVPARNKAKAATRATYYDHFILHNVAGYEVPEAYKRRTKKDLPPIQKVVGIPGDPEFENIWTRHSKLTMWRKWSGQEQDMPRWLDHHAKLLNKEERMKHDARFGYGVMYYVYVEGWSEEAALAYVKPDKSSPLEYKVDSLRKGKVYA